MEAALKTAFKHLKEVLSFLENLKEKKQRKEREDLIAKLRVFLKQNEDVLTKDTSNDGGSVYDDVSFAGSTSGNMDYTDVAASKPDYGDVVPENEELYQDTKAEEENGIYEDNVDEGRNKFSTQAGPVISSIACEELTSAIMADFLEIKREKSLIRATWQKRWCVIQGNVLYMFDSSSDKKQKDAVELNQCVVTVRDSLTKEAKRKERCFEIKLPQNNKIYEFCASEKEVVAKWKRCLEEASCTSSSLKQNRSFPDASRPTTSPTNIGKNIRGFRVSNNLKDSEKSVSDIKNKFKPSQLSENSCEEEAVYDDTSMADTQTNTICDDVYTDTDPEVYTDVQAPENLPFGLSVKSMQLPPAPGFTNPPESLQPLPPFPGPKPKSSENAPSVPPHNKNVRGLENRESLPVRNVGQESETAEFPPPPPSHSPELLDPSDVYDDNVINEDEQEYKDVESSLLFQGMWDCTADESNELSFKRGQIVQIISKEYDSFGWWIAKRGGEVGFVPKDYLMEAYEM